jgi:hypothetical protein
MNRETIRVPRISAFSWVLPICLVVILFAGLNTPVHAQMISTTGIAPGAAAGSGEISSNVAGPANSTTSAGAQVPGMIEAANQQTEADASINWAWLALPAVLGMLILTLRQA